MNKLSYHKTTVPNEATLLDDISDLTLMHIGVSIYDSKYDSKYDIVLNIRHYGEYASVSANTKFPYAMFYAVDYIYRSNKNSWNNKKHYVKDVFYSILKSTGWYDNDITPNKVQERIWNLFFDGGKPSFAPHDAAYLTSSPYNYVNLTNEGLFGKKDFSGMTVDEIKQLKKSEKTNDIDEYNNIINSIFVSVSVNFSHVDFVWKYKYTENDMDAFKDKLGDILKIRNNLTKDIFPALCIIA
jgi:hypothetical protein